MKIQISVETEISKSSRTQQLESMFDCPVEDKIRLEWEGDFPFEAVPWNVGLLVGPSGAGKSTILRKVFGAPAEFAWVGKSVIDDFDSGMAISEISEICRAVGFNTIPAWMRPFQVLSTGERFRVELARRLASSANPIIADEFTSVVDRQVAKIGANAVQKYVRANNRQFVAASCHYDVIDWLQPDWILEPATMSFTRRSLRRRPELDVTIAAVAYEAWTIFAPFHYMSAELNKSARCYGLFINDQIVGFTAILHRPHAKTKNLKAFTRIVIHPDWQGLGLGPVLKENIAAAYTAMGNRVRSYPAHPSWVRTLARDKKWVCVHKPGTFGPTRGPTSTFRREGDNPWRQGSRPCAVFEYIGPPMEISRAKTLLAA